MDAYLNMRGTQLRVTLKSLTGRKGLGISGIMFGLGFLPTAQTPPFAGVHAFMHGQLYVGSESGGMQYLGQIHAAAPIVFSSGPITTADLVSDLTAEQFDEIDKLRNDGGVTLSLNVYGTLLASGAAEAFFGQLVYRVDVGLWTAVLEQCGRGQRIVTQIPHQGP